MKKPIVIIMTGVIFLLFLSASGLEAQTNQDVVKFYNFNIFLSEIPFFFEAEGVQAVRKKEKPAPPAGTEKSAAVKKKSAGTAEKKKGVSLSEEEQIFQAASDLYRQGNFRAAEDTYIELLQRHPDSKLKFETTYNLGEIKFHTGKDEEAMMYFGKIVQDFPENDFTARAYYRIGHISFKNGDLTNSLRFLSLVEKRYPRHKTAAPEALLLKGKVYIALKQYAHAAASYEAVISAYSDTGSVSGAYYDLAGLYEKEPKIRNLEKALENYQKIVDKYPDSPLAPAAKKRIKYLKENFLEYR